MNAPTNETANINKLDTTNGFLLPILSAIGPDSNDPTKYPIFIDYNHIPVYTNDPKRLSSNPDISHSVSNMGKTIEIAYVSPASHIPINPTIMKT